MLIKCTQKCVTNHGAPVHKDCRPSHTPTTAIVCITCSMAEWMRARGGGALTAHVSTTVNVCNPFGPNNRNRFRKLFAGLRWRARTRTRRTGQCLHWRHICCCALGTFPTASDCARKLWWPVGCAHVTCCIISIELFLDWIYERLSMLGGALLIPAIWRRC